MNFHMFSSCPARLQRLAAEQPGEIAYILMLYVNTAAGSMLLGNDALKSAGTEKLSPQGGVEPEAGSRKPEAGSRKPEAGS
jgi:hypothetical protein